MSTEAWANAARQNQYRQTAEHQRAIDTIHSVLDGKVAPDDGAATIASIYEPLLKRGFKISPVATLWGIICDAIRELGGNKEINERLINLLNSISSLPDVTDEQGNGITPEWRSAGVYWRDLPELTIMFREYAIYTEPEPDDVTEYDDWEATQAAPLMNATTFGAMYLARGKTSIGLPWHAEIRLMGTLEEEFQTPVDQRRASIFVPAAATWILLAGEKIYELCKNDFDRKDGASGLTVNPEDWLWGKGRGYSLGRWALWKKRFGDIATISWLKVDVKDIAARAAAEMKRIQDREEA